MVAPTRGSQSLTSDSSSTLPKTFHQKFTATSKSVRSRILKVIGTLRPPPCSKPQLRALGLSSSGRTSAFNRGVAGFSSLNDVATKPSSSSSSSSSSPFRGLFWLADWGKVQALMGGGESFSAGGPGKGMHSRLLSRFCSQQPLGDKFRRTVIGYPLTENPLFMLPESQATIQSAKSSR